MALLAGGKLPLGLAGSIFALVELKLTVCSLKSKWIRSVVGFRSVVLNEQKVCPDMEFSIFRLPHRK